MVLEPNFILGIKQTSLASKEDYHVHATIRSHTCLSSRFRLHGISQPPWLSAVSKIHKLKQTRDINLRFVQNKPSFRETNYTYMLINLLCGKPRTPITLSLCTCLHMLPEFSGVLCATINSWLLHQLLDTHVAMRALTSANLRSSRIWPS